jgi:hypothetical protein
MSLADMLEADRRHGEAGHHGGRARRQRDWRFVPEFTVATARCAAWGPPAPMQPDLDYIGKRLLSESAGSSATAYYEGALYRFSRGDGVIRAQPCVSVGVGAAAEPLYFLYRNAPDVGWTSVSYGWTTLDETESRMAATLAAYPTEQFGAYVWDGATMAWKFF